MDWQNVDVLDSLPQRETAEEPKDRLYRLMDDARTARGMTWTDLYAEAGVSHETGRQARMGWHVSPKTRKGLEQALGWGTGSIAEVLRGGSPAPGTSGPRVSPARKARSTAPSEITEIKFVDSLPAELLSRTRGRPRWGAEIAPQLRAQPGRWALIGSWSRLPAPAFSRVSQIRAGQADWAPKGSYEAVTLKTSSGGVELYARYVGGEGQ